MREDSVGARHASPGINGGSGMPDPYAFTPWFNERLLDD